MKKILIATLIVVLVVVAHSCKKSSVSGNNNNNNNTPQPTAVGTPTGPKTSKFIPKSGGTIASADGNLEIDIPAGALSADDTISIQPITNNCPGGIGHAYRLSPDGLKFNQPVTLKFHYDDSVLKSTLPDFMLLAFQDTSRIWFVLNNVHNDTSQHIISGKTLHFSDWIDVEEVAIRPVSATLKAGEKIHLYIINTEVATAAPSQADVQGFQLLKGNKSTWAVNGVTNGNDQYGTITTNLDVFPDYDYVTYTAPSKAPPPDKNPVLISAEFNQPFTVPNPDGSLGKANKAILYAHIYIIDGGYHVELKFEADTLNESGTIWSWKDKGSFDVVLAGKGGSVKNINNSDA
ncbi:MAG TPA: hypothetical protein VGZ71_12415, partial [Puia sp.]|nr:hypothetical protein [Puia sp.]